MNAKGGANILMQTQNTGNVGIGTSTPASPLVVQGNTGTGVMKVSTNSNLAGDNWWIGFNDGGNNSTDNNDRARIGTYISYGGAGNLFFTTGTGGAQAERMRIDGGGNVGIGTSTPGAKLDINGNVKIADGTQSAGYVLTSDANGVASWKSKAVHGNVLSNVPDGVLVAGIEYTPCYGTASHFVFLTLNGHLYTQAFEGNGITNISGSGTDTITFTDGCIVGTAATLTYSGGVITLTGFGGGQAWGLSANY